MSENSPPANILGICDPSGFSVPRSGYNLFRPFSYSSLQQDSILWESLILTNSRALDEEDTCTEAGESASWFCISCKHLRGQGLESFTEHFSSRQHMRLKSHGLEEATKSDSARN
ncbi:hypothetical protein CARUB_v10027880mg [Capsella rubella]|uniref:Uncharacterized protein n=1 Tax=Capsella rubella TaxID=81985 RepID=R0F054_9BRAS|nr:hypothetical protein CARUB_v10027880mg [Capsella rubella]